MTPELIPVWLCAQVYHQFKMMMKCGRPRFLKCRLMISITYILKFCVDIEGGKIFTALSHRSTLSFNPLTLNTSSHKEPVIPEIPKMNIFP